MDKRRDEMVEKIHTMLLEIGDKYNKIHNRELNCITFGMTFALAEGLVDNGVRTADGFEIDLGKFLEGQSIKPINYSEVNNENL